MGPLRLHLGDFADAFIKSDLQPFIHTFTHRRRSRPHRAAAGWSGAVRLRPSPSGAPPHAARGTRDGTSNLLATSRPAPPPELLLPRHVVIILIIFSKHGVWFKTKMSFQLVVQKGHYCLINQGQGWGLAPSACSLYRSRNNRTSAGLQPQLVETRPLLPQHVPEFPMTTFSAQTPDSQHTRMRTHTHRHTHARTQ